MKKKILAFFATAAVVCSAAIAVGCGDHALHKVDAKDATCAVDGNIEYYKCYVDGCGKYFTDEHGNNEIALADTVIKATGHTSAAIGEAIDPTCTENGITAGEKCSTCGVLIAEQQAVTFTGHKPTHVEYKEATCATDGTVDHYECSDCGESFADDKCTVELGDVRIRALGHAFGEWEHMSGDKHKKVCDNDPTHFETAACRYGKISDFTDETGHFLTCIVCDGKSEKKPHDLRYRIDGNAHTAECRTCEYVSDSTEHAPAKLEVEITGNKLYGGRTMSASDIAVVSVCECGHKTALTADDIVFDDATLVDGQNTLSVGYGRFTQEFTYNAPTEPRFALNVVGATFDDGTGTVMLREGDRVTAAPTPSETHKTFLGYRIGLDVSADLSDFVMPDKEQTVYALYEEDTVPYAPADKAQQHFSTETYDHVVLDSGIVATRFIWSDDEAHKDMKYPHSGGDTGTHRVNVNTPARGKSLMFIYVVNNGAKDVELIYQTENYGVRAEIAITAKSGQTTRVPFVYSDADPTYGSFSTCDHRIALKDGARADGETITLDIYGRLVSTENNGITRIKARLDKTDYAQGDKIDLSTLEATVDYAGYDLILTGYDCNVTDGQDWTSDIERITIGFAGYKTWFDLNSEYSDWIHATMPANPKDGWLTATHITDADTGLPSTRFVFKAGTAANSDTYTDPTPDKGTGAGYNTSMPQYVGKTRAIKLFVKNTSGQTLKFRAYWENYGDIGGANVELGAGESGVYDVQITASGNYGTTTGCRVNIKLAESIGDADASFEMYSMYKTFDNEIAGISVEASSKHKTTFAVGETFDASKLELKVSSSLGSAGNVRITNNITADLDGYVFTADDVGEHTVTVVWNGLPTTYDITVTA